MTKILINQNTFLNKWLQYCNSLQINYEHSMWSGLFLLSLMCKNYKLEDGYKTISLNLMLFIISKYNNCLYDELYRVIVDNALCDSVINGPSNFTDIQKIAINNTKNKKDTTISCVGDVNVVMKNSNNFNCFRDLYLHDWKRKLVNGRTIDEYKNVYISCCLFSDFDRYMETIIPSKTEDLCIGSNIVIPNNKFSKQTYKQFDIDRELQDFKKEVCKKEVVYVAFSSNAAVKFNNYCKQFKIHDPRFASYRQNIRTFAFKLAGLLTINNKESEVSEETVNNVFVLLRNIYKDIKTYLFKQELGEIDTSLGKCVMKIRKHLLQNGECGIKHSKLFNLIRNLCDSATFNTIMDLMHETEIVDKYIQRKGKAIVYIRNTNTQTLNINDFVKKLLNRV